MIFNSQQFDHDLITKYVTLFGNMFNQIVMTRSDTANNVTQSIKVPLSYGPKEKMMARLLEDPELNKASAIVLPQIQYEITGYTYAPDRKIGSLQRKIVKIDDEKNKLNYIYNAVPYDLFFNLYIYVKNNRDGNKIAEQIIPFFTPDYTVSAELVPEMEESRDIPVILQSVNMTDVYDGDFKERRTILWTLSFVMHAWFYGPVKTKPIIKFITLNQRLANQRVDSETGQVPEISNTNPITEVVTIQPGLLANGSPTTNAAASINYLEIAIDSNWDYAITQTNEVGE